MITGAEAITKSLIIAGVEYTFGMPGFSNLELFDTFCDYDLKNILVTSESNVAFMADGYGRVTDKTGVCVVVPGPGITNMLTGLAEAFTDSSPLVVLVTGIDKDGKEYHTHQIDQLDVVKPVVKKIITIQDPKNISKDIQEAFLIALSGEPGPVVVEISKKILNEKFKYIECQKEENSKEYPGKDNTIEQIINLLTHSKKCGIYIGRGAGSASNEIMALAEKLNAPVATTVSGKGIIPDDHKLSVGFGFGSVGAKVAYEIFKECDVVLALGCKFSDLSTGSWTMEIPGTLIHVDQNSDVFNKNYQASITLCSDVKYTVEKIIVGLQDFDNSSSEQIISKIAKAKSAYFEKVNKSHSIKGVHPSQIFLMLRKLAPRNTVFTADCGNHQLWSTLELQVFSKNAYLAPSNYQAMGFGIPAAIGASLGKPQEKVVCICGDGGFLISGFEILTAVRNKLNIGIIIFNDKALGLIKELQEVGYSRTSSVDLINPNYEHLSKAFGIKYIEIKKMDELENGLQEMISQKGVCLVNIHVDYKRWSQYIDGVIRSKWKKMTLFQKVRAVCDKASKSFR